MTDFSIRVDYRVTSCQTSIRTLNFILNINIYFIFSMRILIIFLQLTLASLLITMMLLSVLINLINMV